MITPIGSSSAGNAIVFDDLLLDCGISINDIRKYIDLTELSGCLLTHEHQDHASAAQDILDAGIQIFASRGTLKSLGLQDHPLTTSIKHQNSFQLNNWSVKSFSTVHQAEDPRGFLFQRKSTKGLYLVDTCYSKYVIKNLTHLLIETNYSKDTLISSNVNEVKRNRVIKGHFALEDAIEFIKSIPKNKLKVIWLLHLSDSNSDEKLFKKKVQEVASVPVKVAPKRLDVS